MRIAFTFIAAVTVALCAIFGHRLLAQPVVVAGANSAPAIVAQPTGKHADYGSEVTFNVSARGADLQYRWQKNGKTLSDYKNVAGSHTASLHLVGVALNDVGTYQVVIINPGGTVTSGAAVLKVNPLVVFDDNFEAGLTNWKAVPGAHGLVADATANHTKDGTFSAAGLNGSQRSYHSLDKKVHARFRLKFWMYDDGEGKSAYGDVRGYSGEAGFAHYVAKYRAAFRQSFGIGYRTSGDSDTQAVKGEKLDPSKYQAYVFRGTNHGWMNLDAPGAPARSRGWHKFEIERHNNESIVDFYVDDVLGKSVKGVRPSDIDTITIASWASDSNTAFTNVARFDDVKLDEWPRTFDSKSVTSQGPFSDLTKLREVGTNGEVAGITAVIASEVTGSGNLKAVGDWKAEKRLVRFGLARVRGIRSFNS